MAVVDGRLYVFVIARSPKRIDLEVDGRYAFHTHQDPAAPSEAALRGRARLVTDPDVRARIASGWAFTADDGYALFELDIENARARRPPDRGRLAAGLHVVARGRRGLRETVGRPAVGRAADVARPSPSGGRPAPRPRRAGGPGGRRSGRPRTCGSTRRPRRWVS